ncbi:MAG: hypothetical protein U5K84_03570 [Alkalibacterium sp.]|nr:hypothetical protein [Alkalibacterium sp.]
MVELDTSKRWIQYFQGYWNSFFIAASATILTLYFSSLTAYAFIVYEFKGKKLIWAIILMLIMIPARVGIIVTRFMANLDLLNDYYSADSAFSRECANCLSL